MTARWHFVEMTARWHFVGPRRSKLKRWKGGYLPRLLPLPVPKTLHQAKKLILATVQCCPECHRVYVYRNSYGDCGCPPF
jgi:hypothetical protein